ncbi:MAG: Gfo/Idh/MocA family protein [Candidatus Eiseniibacteriota bacterium]
MNPLRLGVLGLGKMGRHHVRCAAAAKGVRLVAACDVDPARGEGLGQGVRFTTELPELLERCDAVVLAAPTDRHAELGVGILEAGRHLLVEKPLAANVAECGALERAAAAAGRVLRVGHVERWNGAVLALPARPGRPRFVEGHRLAAFDPRGTEVDVVLDLMIHDLDLVLRLFAAEPVRVEAVGVPVLTDRVDIANARLEFDGGELVNLTASRVSREPIRKLRYFDQDAYVSIDLGAQQAEIFSRDGSAPGGVSRAVVSAPEGHNPLVCELESFARACRGEASPIPDAAEATRSVVLARRIVDAIDERAARWSAAGPMERTAWARAPS